MNINDLANKTTKQFVNVGSGIGESIDYSHESISVVITGLKVSPQSGSYLHTNEERKKDAMSFFGVFLDNEPEKNDLITYNGITWKVELFEGTNPYNIVAYHKKNTITQRPRR